MRLVPDHSRAIRRADEVTFCFDGETVEGRPGEAVALALLRAGRLRLRNAPVDGEARGLFCCMGLCQECAVLVDGAVVEGCRLEVMAGLDVYSLGRRGG